MVGLRDAPLSNPLDKMAMRCELRRDAPVVLMVRSLERRKLVQA
jgi:hypothetical protein